MRIVFSILSALILVIFSHVVSVGASNIDVDLYVEGCNNNTVCEAVIGEDLASCPNDCTPPPPTPTPSSTSSQGGNSGTRSSPTDTSGGGVILDFVTVTQSSSTAVIRWQSATPVKTIVVWGARDGLDGGALAETDFTLEHSAKIYDLTPGTSYSFTLTLMDAFGKTLVYQGNFTTNTLDILVVGNVSRPIARFSGDQVALSWSNPTNENFDYVRIVKTVSTIPRGPFDGELIYEGRGQSAFDARQIDDATTYFYAFYARTQEGLFSSGVIVPFRITQESSILDNAYDGGEGIDVSEFGPIYHYPYFQHPLVNAQFDFIQDGKTIPFLNDQVIIDSSDDVEVVYTTSSNDDIDDILMFLYPNETREPFIISLVWDDVRGVYKGVIPGEYIYKKTRFFVVTESDGGRFGTEGYFIATDTPTSHSLIEKIFTESVAEYDIWLVVFFTLIGLYAILRIVLI